MSCRTVSPLIFNDISLFYYISVLKYTNLYISAMSVHTILVTGGAGYVGSHVIVELISAGYSTVIIDNRAEAVKGKTPEFCIFYLVVRQFFPSFKTIQKI